MSISKKMKRLCLSLLSLALVVTAFALSDKKIAQAATTTITSSQIANSKERAYVNKAIKYYLGLPELQKTLNEKEEPVIFLFEGASNNQTSDSKVRTAAVCIVIKKVQGNLDIVYFNDLCTTLPDNPTNYDIATTKDGIYHVRAVDHGLEKGHEKYATGKYAALNVQAISSDGSYSDYIPAVRWGELIRKSIMIKQP